MGDLTCYRVSRWVESLDEVQTWTVHKEGLEQLWKQAERMLGRVEYRLWWQET